MAICVHSAGSLDFSSPEFTFFGENLLIGKFMCIQVMSLWLLKMIKLAFLLILNLVLGCFLCNFKQRKLFISYHFFPLNRP